MHHASNCLFYSFLNLDVFTKIKQIIKRTKHEVDVIDEFDKKKKSINVNGM